MPPKVTVGMPVYNGAEYLEAAIQNILQQSFRDFELIISDNCSTDNTAEVCHRLAAADPRIRYIRQAKNLGAIGNFNALVRLATGQYFKWAAHDDLMEPNYLERCVQVLDQNKDVVWCHSKSDMIDAQGRSLRELLPDDDYELIVHADGTRSWKGLPRDHFDSADPILRFRGVVLGTNWCVDSYGLFRLASLKATRLLQHFYGAEKVLMAEISLQGRYAEVPEMLFYQRIHDKASSSLNTTASQASFADSSRRMRRFLWARLQVPLAHLGGLWASQLSTWQKLRGTGVLLRYFLQVGKWGRVFNKLVQGSGLGGGGRRILQQAATAGETEASGVRS